ncbi:MAG: hypothetical protein K9N47_13565 [Prosthecobacter sp.]|uniref:hypothetical protein n=1 Tax=Prosthecobacter sp. TaxID=1965333 RepID=UPI0025D2B75B|nr:hypothetical protein [Prosthecobacter sp.]MCF7787149.1 hypothetical protein [Prosthecobacter sp.]
MNQNEPHSTPNAPVSWKLRSDELQKEVDAAAAFGLFPPIEVEVLADAPSAILVSPKAGEGNSDLSNALDFIAKRLLPRHDDARNFLFRGVELTRLGQVIDFGCDVTPTTAPIYASEYAKKALEYGSLVMVFDSAKLDKTFRKVPKSESAEKLSRLKAEYPTAIEEAEHWWFSLLPAGNGRTGTFYESYFTFFIPGDPREALLMLFLIGNDRNALRAEFQQRARPSQGGPNAHA